MNIEVRDAQPEDAGGIREVFYTTWLATYPNEEAGITKDDIEDFYKDKLTKEHIQKRAEGIKNLPPNEKLGVSVDGDKIIGVCRMVRKKDRNQLQAIYVLPEYQGKGVGNQLWEFVFPFADSEKDIYVEVAEYNRGAIGFYKKLGFVKTDRQRFTEEKFKMKSGAHLWEIELVLKH